MKKTILLYLLLSITISMQNSAQAQNFYQKKSSWVETLIASRIAIDKELKLSEDLYKLVLGPWFCLGPVVSKTGHSFSEAFAPEAEFNINDEYENGQYKWTARPGWKDGEVIDFPQLSNSAVYLQRTISYVTDTVLTCYLGSDDGIKVWFNGNVVHEHDIDRACSPRQNIVELKLKKGENKLVMKINNNSGGFAFCFSTVEAPPRELVWLNVERDFRKPDEMREISWEKQNHIWDTDIKEGDYSNVAERYAAVIKDIDQPAFRKIEKQLLNVKTVAGLLSVRSEYVKARLSEYKVLTPKPSNKPRINGAVVYGVRPGAPFLYRIAATGKRPMEFSAVNLPGGLTLDNATGIITGSLSEKNNYTVTLKARNNLGTAERKLTIKCGDRIALTPPMGWNSWNCFADAVSAEKVRLAADAMVKSGLINHGWTYINIDDFWENRPGSADPALMGEARDKEGFINTNKNFPDMKALGDYIHSRGLKMGIYSSPGPLTCGGCTASYGFEAKDAQKYKEWGVDYLKYDWCSYSRIPKDNSLPELKKPYILMREELNKLKRDIVFSLCQYGMGNVWEWGDEVGGNCWRTTGDIVDTWQSLSSIGFSQAGHEKYAKPGSWNDPDMLIVGMVGWGANLHPTRLTANEQYTHISLWSLLASPLLIGCDMTQMDDFTFGLLTNDEVIEVNQDPLGKQASRVSVNGALEVWTKQMQDGSIAAGLFNRGDSKADITAEFRSLGLSGRCLVRDIWRQKDEGTFNTKYKATVPAHGVKLIRITGKANHRL